MKHGRAHCAARCLEGGEHGVTRRVDQAAAMGLDVRAEHAARRIERTQAGYIVQSHQARVASRIRGQNHQKSMPDVDALHAGTLPERKPSIETASLSADTVVHETPHAAMSSDYTPRIETALVFK